MTLLTRRSVLGLTLSLPAAFGCANPMAAVGARPPGSLKENAKLHGYIAANNSYGWMMGHAYYWPRLLDPLSKDGYALLEALKAKGYGLAMDIKFNDPKDSAAFAIEYAFPKKGDPPPQKPYPPVAVLDGVDVMVLSQGKIAFYSVVAMMSQLNVSNELLQQQAFAMLVLKEKVKKGEKADWMGGERPAEESLSDIALALQIIGEHYKAIQTWRSKVLTMVALINAFNQPGGMEALRAEVDKARKDSQHWLDTHRRPTQDDFGVAMAELPTPESLVKKLDVDLGIVSAAIQTAAGIATGSPQMTLEGLSKLAPKDSTVGVALQGLTAATKGDVSGVIDSVAKLTGKEEEVAAVKERLAPFAAMGKKAGVI